MDLVDPKPLIVDLGSGLAGLYADALFVDAGADVVLVEPPDGCDTRRAAEVSDDTPWGYLGRGLLSIVPADAGDGESRADIDRLLELADLVLTSDSTAIWRRDDGPSVIAISPFGAVGPRAGWRGGELCVEASGGYASLTGPPDGPPVGLPGSPFHYLTGLASFIWGMAVLRAARGLPGPVRVDLSMEDTVTANLEYAVAMYAWMGLVKRRELTYPFAFPHDLFEAADGFVSLSLGTRDPLLMLGIAVGEPGLADLEGFDTEWSRARRHREFRDRVAPLIRRLPRKDFFEVATELRVPAGFVVERREIPQLPPLVARAALQEIGAGVGGSGFVLRRPLAHSSGVVNEVPAVGSTSVSEVVHERAARKGLRPVREGEQTVPDPTARGPQSSVPLEGLVVLDLTVFYAGPTATRILAELGAEVIRVSSIQAPGRGAGLGMVADYEPGDDPWNASSYYYDRLAGKKEVTLDLTTPAGLEAFRRLVSTSDALVTNFSTRALAQLGVSPEALLEINPSLLVAQISGFGATGPWADLPSVGPAIEAIAGLASALGTSAERGEPLLPGTSLADAIAGYWAAAGILQLLDRRDRTGRGGTADISMLEGCLAVFPELIGGCRDIQAQGSGEGLAGVFPCTGDDRWIAIEVSTEAEWDLLLSVLSPPSADASAETVPRGQRRALIASFTRSRDAGQLEVDLQRAGVAAAAVRDARDIVSDVHLRSRGTVEMVQQHRGTGPTTRQLPGVTSDLLVGVGRGAPTVGEHNHEILVGRLGYTEEELAELERAGVIGSDPIAPPDTTDVLDPEAAMGAGLVRAPDPDYRAVAGRESNLEAIP